MKSYYLYILKCSDDSFYTGITNNLERRLAEHLEGKSPTSYTAGRRPVELVFYEQFQSPDQAIRFEKKLKRWSRKKKEALILGEWDKLQEYAKCKNLTSHINFQKGKC